MPSLENFGAKIIKWWKKNKRQFPWREKWDPYRILIAEILLHRTRAEQVAPIYIEFMSRFPDIYALARAPKEEVKRLLRPLGLHWRTDLLHRMAADIVRHFGGRIPAKQEDLESLPGIGQYIASAVRCFGFGYPEVILDTNTVRIAGRVFGVRVTDGARRSKRFRKLLRSLMGETRGKEFNLAMLDLGALICRPRSPKCNTCPVVELCKYGREGRNQKQIQRIR